ncbi:TatD family hydrolase [Malacoplasma iowae]|uniref:TatD family hydrolase n=1 Tax=Malacoplasma iowae 695 TaxID=1048830 RepID=A0A6P1LFG0_MALIO|nr:TatD family hydrolase [Malacoplasma iowae]VEU61635.1 TatD family deoxyribonuclease [Mycoplasmopsis fermentans]EGZ31176.1 hypothetical protein GUU_03328 [Malacoplasma iowae 695]QHG90219.1 TatD family hydrolase [Malacoplasma iowae 695]WPL36028.1 TatD family hydrolase [Malacoplasma iowae]VEU71306.1 TatD family deoxyribonuclease [Malacoplasma iowae]
MKIKYYDTHSHINLEPQLSELENILKTMEDENTITNLIGVDIESSKSSIELSRKYPNILKCAIGFHPESVDVYKENMDEVINQLEDLIKNNLDIIVAIGEIGLDYTYDNFDKNLQKYLFKKQIELAIKYDLPINIHNRDASDDVIEILKEYNYKKVMIHCFYLNYEYAKKFLDINCFLSIPGMVTFKNKSLNEFRECIKHIPIEKMVVETDSPYLTPEPFRGKMNYPYYVKYVVEKIAEIKEMDVEEARKILLNNSLNFFKIKSN